MTYLYKFQEVPDPDGSLADAFEDLLDNDALEPVHTFSPAAIEAAHREALRLWDGGTLPPSLIESVLQTALVKEATTAALQAAWDTDFT